MAADLIVERAHTCELFDERGCHLRLSGFEPAADLPRQPGLALRGTSDHHGVGAGRGQRLARILEAVISPLTTTGTETASLTVRTAVQSAGP